MEYGLTTSYGNQVSLKTMVTSHQLTLSGLSPGKLYHYRVKSTDDTTNLSTSGDLTFTTTNSPTPTPTPTPPPPPGSPVISSFTASPVAITSGQSSVLSWGVTGQTSLSLDQGIGTVTGVTISVTPSATTTYRLTATNNVGSVFRTVTVTVSNNSPGAPELPRVFLNTGYIPPTGRTINVAAGQSVQAAIDQALPGDVVMLQAGATFSGNFTLPNKSGSGWIIIRSSASDADLPPPGMRVTPANSALMPKLISPNSDPAVQTNGAAHHYRFIGIEFGVAQGVNTIYNVVSFGGNQSTLAQTPNNLIIDRCYIHGNPSGNARRGVLLNSASTAIIDSYISDIHEIGADAQAVCGWNGPGPFKIVNNHLEGSGENVLFGGAAQSLPNLIPSDIEFRLNRIYKPLSWKRGHPSYAGRPWTIKNLFELKNAQRMLVDQNIFENNWLDAQVGFAIVFTPRGEGVAPYATVADITFTNNIVRHSGCGVQIAGPDDSGPSQTSQRILFKNNLFDDIDGDRWGSPEGPADGRFAQMTGPRDVTFDHNTIFQTGYIIIADVAQSPGFVYINNISPHNEYGVLGGGKGVGLGAINFYFPGAIFQKNVIVGVPEGVIYPANNFLLVSASLDQVGFVNRAGGDYRLGPNSPYRNAGTDGRDIGCDVTALPQ